MRLFSQTFMKTRIRLLLIAALALPAGAIASLAEPILSWHTNMGSVSEDYGHAVAVDGSGNVYVAGWSEATWGSNPIHPYAGGRDAFLAKLDSSGALLWHTFMGSSGWDEARSVAVDGDGNVYVVGTSDADWGTPVHSHVGGEDGFAVKLNSDGELQWHTFMGHSGTEWGRAIAVDTSGTVYVAGTGGWSWDTDPVNPWLGHWDVWVTKLNTSGVRQWHTFMGSEEGQDLVRSMAVDDSGNVYVAARSDASWGSPVNPHAGGTDAFVAKLNTSGALLWHTFMGSAGEDFGSGLAVDGSGNAYFSGSSKATWGTPINPFASSAGVWEGFAAKLNSNGSREWHTFLGVGLGWGMAIDESRNIFVGDIPHSVQLSPDGILQRNFTMPSGGSGAGGCIAVDPSRNVYFGGGIDYDWGTPVNPHAGVDGSWDAYVVKFEISVEIDIDIKPGSDPNCFNSNGHGVIPVAINGSAEFDVYDIDIDIETLLFAGMEVAVRGNRGPLCAYEYSNDDAFLDLVCHFEDDAAKWSSGGESASLTGTLLNGTQFEGTDTICVVP